MAVTEPVLRRRRRRAEELADGRLLRPECAGIFQVNKTEDGTPATGPDIRFYRHQAEAIEAARAGGSYVLTTGTGSGKSLAYIVPIVDHVLAPRAAAGPSGSRPSSSTR